MAIARITRISGAITLLITIFSLSLPAYCKVIYVDNDATTGANDGTDWKNAYVYLQDALADANSAEKPVQVKVAQGIYKPDQGGGNTIGDRHATFQLINGVTIKGGYAGFGESKPNTRDVSAYKTILSGDLNVNDIEQGYPFNDHSNNENTYHVVTGSGTDSTAVLDCFTITAGAPSMKEDGQGSGFGGGMYIFKGSPTLIACTFTANWAEGPRPAGGTLIGYGAGGGMYNSFSSPKLVNCTFVRNWAGGNFSDGYGGGMYNISSTPILINCTFNRNGAGGGFGDGYGGGMYNRNSDPVLINCTFSSNDVGGMSNRRSSPKLLNCTFTGNEGAGMQNSSGSDLMLINCIFSGNVAGWRMAGGAILNSSSNLTIINCTFVGNSVDGGNALVCESSNVQVINSIFWDGGNEISKDDDSNITIAYSDVQGGWPGEGNIDADPCFIKAGYWNDSDEFWVDGDYRLQSQAGRWDPNNQTWIQDKITSPCADAGDNSSLPAWVFEDLDGYQRIRNDTVDMGAYESGEYEFSTTDFVLSTKWVTIPEAETATFTIMLSRDPLGTIEVTVAHQSGDTDITVDSGALLTFDSSNYTQPQPVTLKSAVDVDYLRGMALFLVSAPGLAPASIIAGESDNDETPPLFVDADAVGANDGSCWVDAFINLQDALSLARINLYIKQIRVAQGVYRPDRGEGITIGDQTMSFELIDGVALMGAYAGFGETNPNARDIKQYETILSGDLNGNDAKVVNAIDLSAEPTRAENTYRIVNATDIDATTVFDGFTITGGNGWNLGAGMWNDSANTTISNCTFRCNSVKLTYDLEDGESMVGEGGGLYNTRSNPTIINCTFSSNAAYWGGGMAQRWSNPILINCIFSSNYAIGAAIANEQNSNLRLLNCTFSGNSSGVIRNSGDSLELTNCIIWGNSGYSIYNYNNRGTIMVSYSNIQGGWLDTGNIAADPLFTNPQKGDYHLKSQAGRWNADSRNWIYDDVTSPCIDTGDPTSPIGPEPLPNGGRINMGAYGGTAEASKSP